MSSSGATRPASPRASSRASRALQLTEAERTHLLDLLRTASTIRPPRRRPARQRVRPTVQRVMDSMAGTPAFVLNGRLDILTANELGYALYSPVYADPVRPPNNARFVFLDPHATEFFRDLGHRRQRHLLASWAATTDGLAQAPTIDDSQQAESFGAAD